MPVVRNNQVYIRWWTTWKLNFYARCFSAASALAPPSGRHLVSQIHQAVQCFNRVARPTPPPNTFMNLKSFLLNIVCKPLQLSPITTCLLGSVFLRERSADRVGHIILPETPYPAAIALPLHFLLHLLTSDTLLPTFTTQKCN